MRLPFFYLLLILSLTGLPTVIQASEGPVGHHHDHQPKVKASHDEHDHQSSPVEEENKPHDHGAHTWQAPEEEKKRPNPVAATSESIATGQRLFRHYCITCHGYHADGDTMRGQNLNPKAANLQQMAGHHSDGDYHYKIRTGHGPMPHWEHTISAKNIWHLVNYLQSLKPEKVSDDSHSQHRHKSDTLMESAPHHDHSGHKH